MSRPEALQIALESLRYQGAEGLVTRDEPSDVAARSVLWDELVNKCEVDAAYFRGSVPLVAFADVDDDQESRRVHSKLWNLSRVPILITTSASQTAAYSCFIPPVSSSSDSTAQMVRTLDVEAVGQVLSDFNRFNVEAGRAAKAFPAYFKRNGRVDAQLLSSLRVLRRRLRERHKSDGVDEFIGRTILVRYLEDRGVLTPEHLRELVSADSFFDVLNSGASATAALFERLGEKFNGDVFAPMAHESLSLSDGDLGTVAAFFRGADLASGQERLWPFDFSIIPSELVSSIYEQLLEESQRSDAAYYTPRQVVDLMLDEVLPWDGTDLPTILDPACGSGIFLSEAFRRLVYRDQKLRGGEEPEFARMSDLLTRHVFGVDQNPVAVQVAAFGLYLALLEQFDPPTIWQQSRLPRLIGSNLRVSDFFETDWSKREKFDLVVGNPPWKSRMTPSAREFSANRELVIPDKQIALAFLWKAEELIKADGAVALLMPAKPLLHNKSGTATRLRHRLISSLSVETIIDLSPLRHVTFTAAIAPSAVIVIRGSSGGEEEDGFESEILHVAVRDSPLQSTIDGFVISQEDVHVLSRRRAMVAPDVWKTLLWGDTNDLELVESVRGRFRTVGEIARTKGWVHGQGFQVEGGDENDASHLLGARFVPTEAVESFVVKGGRQGVRDATMHRPRSPKLFKGPHLLIRRGLVGGHPAAVLVRGNAAFNNGVFGIASPKRDLPQLRLLEACINSSFGRYFLFMTSSSWGVERDFVEANEYLSLPLPEERDPTWDRLFALLDLRPKMGSSASDWRSRLDQAVYDVFGLTPSERIRVEETLSIRLDMFRKGASSRAFDYPDQAQLEGYASSLHDAIESSLRSLDIDVVVSHGSQGYLVATVSLARQGDGPPRPGGAIAEGVFDRLVAHAESAAQDWPLSTTVVMPVLIVADADRVHLVKPRERRYWASTVGRDDAGRVLAALLAASPSWAEAG